MGSQMPARGRRRPLCPWTVRVAWGPRAEGRDDWAPVWVGWSAWSARWWVCGATVPAPLGSVPSSAEGWPLSSVPVEGSRPLRVVPPGAVPCLQLPLSGALSLLFNQVDARVFCFFNL